ncbi:HAD hydrolase-like protein [Candidatus Gracilibacteria bacterium]|nr:HAD hydrolase-like protein [Candidatus Gracilibacteria bacterium]
MEKIIGIDLDEVLSETVETMLKSHNNMINGMSIYKEDISDYYIFNIKKYKISQEDAVKYFRSFYDQTQSNDDIPAIKGSADGLKRLKKNGWKIVIVTARREDIKDITISWLDHHFPGLWDDILFASHFTDKQINKSELCKQNGINIMIEDNLDYAIEMANEGIKMYLLDKPWNKKFDPELNKGITKFYNWNELNIGN